MYARHESDVAARVLKSRKVKTLLDQSMGCRNLCLGMVVFDGQGRAPGHVHQAEEEAIYVLSGHGRIYLGEAEEELRPGMAVYIPVGVEHSIENLGSEPIRLVFAFSPPVVSGDYPDIDYDP